MKPRTLLLLLGGLALWRVLNPPPPPDASWVGSLLFGDPAPPPAATYTGSQQLAGIVTAPGLADCAACPAKGLGCVGCGGACGQRS